MDDIPLSTGVYFRGDWVSSINPLGRPPDPRSRRLAWCSLFASNRPCSWLNRDCNSRMVGYMCGHFCNARTRVARYPLQDRAEWPERQTSHRCFPMHQSWRSDQNGQQTSPKSVGPGWMGLWWEAPTACKTMFGGFGVRGHHRHPRRLVVIDLMCYPSQVLIAATPG